MNALLESRHKFIKTSIDHSRDVVAVEMRHQKRVEQLLRDVSCFQLCDVEGAVQVRLVRQRLNCVKHALEHLLGHVLPQTPIEEHVTQELRVADDRASVVREADVVCEVADVEQR